LLLFHLTRRSARSSTSDRVVTAAMLEATGAFGADVSKNSADLLNIPVEPCAA